MFPASEHTALILIDWQERLQPAMPHCCEQNQLNAEHLLWFAGQCSMPVVVTEQYPKGLGPTVESLRVLLPDSASVIEKRDFSAAALPHFNGELAKLNIQEVVLIGMETHICVAQTAMDLIKQDYNVWLPVDAVLSRRKLDWQFGIQQMQQTGVRLTTTEALIFSWLGRAEGELFKAFSRRIR